MENRNIIVIGASAGGVEALRQLVAGLPSDLNAAIFIVWHMAPEVRGVLPRILNREKTLIAAYAVDKEPIVYNRIYIAPADKHLLLENGFVRVTRGPKENRFRPAVDPLFRSAAYMYGSRVIGIILSGALDDGTSGLWTVKSRGGITIVQNPAEAQVPSMPESAINSVQVDYCTNVEEMPALLKMLTAEPAGEMPVAAGNDDDRLKLETQVAAEVSPFNKGVIAFGPLSPYACPECHGVLSLITEGAIRRFRCHTGHAYSEGSLLASISEKIEDTLWNAIRGMEELIILLNNLGDHYAGKNEPKTAALYFKKATDTAQRADLLHQAISSHEQLTTAGISEEANGKVTPNAA